MGVSVCECVCVSVCGCGCMQMCMCGCVSVYGARREVGVVAGGGVEGEWRDEKDNGKTRKSKNILKGKERKEKKRKEKVRKIKSEVYQ